MMDTDYIEEARYKAAQKRVKEVKGFYIHLTVYLTINFLIILYSSNPLFFGDGSVTISGYGTAILWGIGLFAHWTSVFGPNLFFGKKWEEKKIKELMDRERKMKSKWE
jgi:hypothetical protein